jgi:hypothetical protein
MSSFKHWLFFIFAKLNVSYVPASIVSFFKGGILSNLFNTALSVVLQIPDSIVSEDAGFNPEMSRLWQ